MNASLDFLATDSSFRVGFRWERDGGDSSFFHPRHARHGAHLRPAGLAGRQADRFCAAHHGPRGESRKNGSLASGSRRKRLEAADHTPSERPQSALVVRRAEHLVPLDPLGLVAGLAHPSQRRRIHAGLGSPARREQPRGFARRLATRLYDGGLPRLSRSRLYDREARGASEQQRRRAHLRESLHPTLGYLEGWPTIAFVRDARGGWRTGGRDLRHGRRHAIEAVRWLGGDYIRSRRPVVCFCGPRCGTRRSLVHELRSIPSIDRRFVVSSKPDRIEPSLGHAAGVLTGRKNARLPRDVQSRLRSGPFPHHASFLARR